MITIGIDPGISGAIAFLAPDGELLGVEDMPLVVEGKKNHVDGSAIRQLIEGYNPTDLWRLPFAFHAVIESVHAMPNQGVTSMFNFGRSFGTVIGVLNGLGVSVSQVRPQAWKKPLDLIGKDKDAARQLAIDLYPEAPLSRKKDGGRADAILIGRHHLL
jgi:crossover junction endodeoxyribonuclease RuvC